MGTQPRSQRFAFGLLVLGLLVLALAGKAERVEAETIVNYQAEATTQVPSLDVGGVTVTGSGTLNVGPAHGLSVLGGIPGFFYADGTVDATESVTFHFDTGPAVNVALDLLAKGTSPNFPMTDQGESLIEAFDASGHSLGTIDQVPPAFRFDVSAAFSGTPISGFRVQPKGDANGGGILSIAGLNYTPATVPEPCAAVGWSVGILAALVDLARRRRP